MSNEIVRQSATSLVRVPSIQIPSDLAQSMIQAIIDLTKEGDIRKTDDDRFSVFDLIECATSKGNPRDVWNRLCKHYPEVVLKTDNLQFPGAGQRKTPVADLTGCLEIIWLLPGDTAKKMRRLGASANAFIVNEAAKNQEAPRSIEDPIMLQLQAALEMRQRQIELERSHAELKRQVEEMQQRTAMAHKELIALPPASHEVPPESTDMKIRRIVNNYCVSTGQQQAEVYRNLYQQFYYRYRRNVQTLERESKIKAFIRLGLIDALYDLAVELFVRNSVGVEPCK